jgi:hypothetical protein
MRVKHFQTLTALTVVIFIAYIIFKLETDDQPQIIHEAVAETLALQKQIVSREAILSAIQSEAQIVGLSGEVAKTVRYHDENWLGKRDAVMTLTGTFKLGVNIADIKSDHVMVSESGTVVIVMPKTVIISLDLPYDQMRIAKSSGLLRKDVPDEELRNMYDKTRGLIISEIIADKDTQHRAQLLTQQAIEQLLRMVDGVEEVRFVEL